MKENYPCSTDMLHDWASNAVSVYYIINFYSVHFIWYYMLHVNNDRLSTRLLNEVYPRTSLSHSAYPSLWLRHICPCRQPTLFSLVPTIPPDDSMPHLCQQCVGSSTRLLSCFTSAQDGLWKDGCQEVRLRSWQLVEHMNQAAEAGLGAEQ